MTKHTPAPWILKPDPDAGNRWDMVVVSDHRYIHCEGRTCAEAQANANLIAASPELLEALKCLLVDYHRYTEEMMDKGFIVCPRPPSVVQAEDAIAKAEGK